MELYMRRQLIISAIVYVGAILYGYILGWSAPVVAKLQDLDLTPLPDVITEGQASWVASVVFIGAIIGPYVSGYLSNWKGRKPCLFFGGVLTLISFLLLMFATDFATIIAGRIFSGLGSGIICVTNFVYLGEIASPNIRGTLITATAIFASIGTVLSYSVAPFVPYYAVNVVGLAITVPYIASLFYVPETPLFCAMKDRRETAKAILEFLGRDETTESVYSSKRDNSAGQWRDLFKVKSNRNGLFITLSLNILQQASGIAVVMLFATTIFEMSGSSVEPALATIIIGVTKLFACFVAPIFVDRSGRRALLLLSTSMCCLSLGILGLYFYLEDVGSPVALQLKWLPLVTLIMFFISYDSGFGVIPGALSGELFYSNVRSTGSTIATTVAWLFGFGVSSAFGYLITSIGGHGTFWLFSGSCALAFVFTIFFVPETRGKTLEQIQDMLK